jgi:integrase
LDLAETLLAALRNLAMAEKLPLFDDRQFILLIQSIIKQRLNKIAHIVHFILLMSTHLSAAIHRAYSKQGGMQAITLYDGRGRRKYLTSAERRAFAVAAARSAPAIQTFCLTLLYTGARVSELLALTPENIDRANGLIVIETLKRRRRGVFRAVPVPQKLLSRLATVHASPMRGDNEKRADRIWNWGRTSAWKHVKAVMESAGIEKSLAYPRSARHAFGVCAIQKGIALNLVQRWMGHARIETTAIYADASGSEERSVARRMWGDLPEH